MTKGCTFVVKPVFIGGCDRSGTTLLGSMLGAGELCITTPESQFKDQLLVLGNRQLRPEEAIETLNYIKNHFRFRIWGSPVPDLKGTGQQLTLPGILELFIREYASSVGKTECTYWIDHTPNNIRQIHRLLRVFPEAKFIHIVRDGRAIAASVIPLSWGPNTVYSAARWWCEKLSFGLAAEQALPDKVCRVYYEELVLRPKDTLEQLCRFIGVPFNNQMVYGKGFKVPTYTANQHQLVGKPPDKNRINAWQKRLSPRDIEVFEYLTKDLLLSLGYEVQFEDPKPYNRKELWSYRGQEIGMCLTNRIKNKKRRAVVPHCNKNRKNV